MAARNKAECPTCGGFFIPPTVLKMPAWARGHCPSCRRVLLAKLEDPKIPTQDDAILGRPPIKQAVFDLETFAIDRGWGVLLMGSILIHDGSPEPRMVTYRLRDFTPWKEGRRSDDSELAKAIISELEPCHLLYAHNGDRFDIRWLRTVALKYKLQWQERKLIDPCQLAWKKYQIGKNTLSNLADFLGLPENKMHVPPDVWRKALMDDDVNSWKVMQERCESDVRLLNEIAGRVTRDVGMINYKGSGF